MKRIKIISLICLIFGMILSAPVKAEGDGAGIIMSPMRESVVLNPGDIYKSSFSVSNPGNSDTDISYHIEIQPFYVNENYDPVFTDEYGSGDIAHWVTITSGATGVLRPNDSTYVEFEINVPEDAPAGGQYVAITAVAGLGTNNIEGGIGISEGIALAHVVLAEITGNTIYGGEITDSGVQSFLLGGMIAGYSTVTNTGNIHALAKYTMKVYPLFSDQPLYSNESNIEDHYILPGRSFYNETFWEDTPSMGIFNVYYRVDFQGKIAEVTRMVIVCPGWLLFIIMLALVILTFRIITLVKLRKVKRAVF